MQESAKMTIALITFLSLLSPRDCSLNLIFRKRSFIFYNLFLNYKNVHFLNCILLIFYSCLSMLAVNQNDYPIAINYFLCEMIINDKKYYFYH